MTTTASGAVIRPVGGGWSAAAAAVVRRPRLWPVAARQAARLTPRRWWRRWPPLPVPDRAYLRFRMTTAYGDPTAAPTGEDVVSYLEWCRRPPTGQR